MLFKQVCVFKKKGKQRNYDISKCTETFSDRFASALQNFVQLNTFSNSALTPAKPAENAESSKSLLVLSTRAVISLPKLSQ